MAIVAHIARPVMLAWALELVWARVLVWASALVWAPTLAWPLAGALGGGARPRLSGPGPRGVGSAV